MARVLPVRKRQQEYGAEVRIAKQPRFVAPRVTPGAVRMKYVRSGRGLKLETKTVDTSVGPLNFDNNSAVANCMQLLNTIPTGTSSVTRVGKAVQMVSVQIRGEITAATATIAHKVALLLVYIRNPNQAATLPAVTEILTAQTSNQLTNRDNASKFKIVRRWEYAVIGNITTPQCGNELVCVDEFVQLGYLDSVWTSASTAGTIAEFEKGALILLAVGDAANGATTTPVFVGRTRVYFKDA